MSHLAEKAWGGISRCRCRSKCQVRALWAKLGREVKEVISSKRAENEGTFAMQGEAKGKEDRLLSRGATRIEGREWGEHNLKPRKL